jgi:hypothetical protein
MKWIITVLTERLGVFRTWGSFGRVAAWVVVWCVAISFVVAPRLPAHTDRQPVADVPASGVRYVAPLSRADLAGYLPPADPGDPFKLAWIGGSEVKLREVSVPGAFDQRVDGVGGRPLVIDSYNVIAPRMIDVLRAVDTAVASGADAIVIALNPAWTRSEWSMRDWPNLDVSNVGTLWSRRSTWSWALALTSPADYGWRLGRAALPVVEAQTRLSEEARDRVEALDIVLRPDEADAAGVDQAGDPRLPSNPTAFWLVQEYGPEILDGGDVRVGGIMDGVGPSQHEAEFFAHLLIEVLADADVPAFLYTTPFAAESLDDPAFDTRAREVEAFWASIGNAIDDPLIELESRSLSRDYASEGTFFNNVHMSDPGPFADILVERLCAQWTAADPTWECT